MKTKIYSLNNDKTFIYDCDFSNIDIRNNFLYLNCIEYAESDILVVRVKLDFGKQVELFARLETISNALYLKKDSVFIHCLKCEIESVQSTKQILAESKLLNDTQEHLLYYLQEKEKK